MIVPNLPDDRVSGANTQSPSRIGTQRQCSIVPFPGLTTVTSVAALQVPAKAQKEYAAACSALKSNQLAVSERHLQKAVQTYPNYVAGWVMLGQIFEAQQKKEQARMACSRAAQADPNYVPAHLCLAEIAGQEEKWNEVLHHSGRALELDSLHDPYAYFFNAIAYFNLDEFAEAERQALKAARLDSEHRQPRVQFLLGQIYKATKDSARAVAQLREYLRYAPSAPDSEAVKQDLARLEPGNANQR